MKKTTFGRVMTDTKKQTVVKHRKAKKSALAMRKELWPDLDESLLWDRKKLDGYSSIPRTMPLLVNIINDLSKQVTGGKAIPAGRSYFVLWCRVFDEGMVQIDNEAIFANEAGYTGERNVTTWREHLKVLQNLKFIDLKAGPLGPYQYVLIYNPYLVVKEQKHLIQQPTYLAFLQRSLDIGAM